MFIEDHYPDKITVGDIAFHIGLDRTYLYRLFKQHMGCPPSKCLLNIRLEKAAEMLENRDLSIAEIGGAVGFHDTSHFYKVFSAKYGMPPRKYRETYYKEG